MRFGFAVDELHGDPYPVRSLAYASFHYIVDAEFAGDLLRLHRLALVDENRVAGDDEKFPEPRKFGDDVLGQPVGEKLLLRITAHIDERQNRYGGLAGAAWGAAWHGRCSIPGGRRLAVQQNLKHADRAADVLNMLLAKILITDVEPVADLIAHRRRDADSARLRRRF